MKLKQGLLIDYFTSFGYKKLSAVEVDFAISNEHEFNGITKFKDLLGTTKREDIKCRVIYLSDDEDNYIEENIKLTWYNARENHPTRNEFRLYYTNSNCVKKANPEDFMILAENKDKSYTMFIAKSNDTVTNQLLWLFGIVHSNLNEHINVEKIKNNKALNYFSNLILEKIGVTLKEQDDVYLDILLEEFPDGLPKTCEFSEFSRNLTTKINDLSDVDDVLVTWLNQEEVLFRTYEKYLVGKKIKKGFDNVENFISFSLSVQNRRKSRVGYAFENHLKYIFDSLNIQYSYNSITENNSKPDFIFPSINKYHDENFNSINLTMLGVKTTCKDRWRQVLSEANKIKHKHLCTLEPSISKNQTNEMQRQNLQLVVPRSIIKTYNVEQQKWLKSLNDFIELIKEKN